MVAARRPMSILVTSMQIFDVFMLSPSAEFGHLQNSINFTWQRSPDVRNWPINFGGGWFCGKFSHELIFHLEIVTSL
jgi:hypothetical protein